MKTQGEKKIEDMNVGRDRVKSKFWINSSYMKIVGFLCVCDEQKDNK